MEEFWGADENGKLGCFLIACCMIWFPIVDVHSILIG